MNAGARALASALEAAGHRLQPDPTRRREGLVILGYHRIATGPLGVSKDDFRAHLDWIDSSGLNVVDLETAAIPERGAPASIAITFDDGYRSVAEDAWPELKARGWPATVFLVVDRLENPRPYPWDSSIGETGSSLIDVGLAQELLADGMSIGSHSLSHAFLPDLSPATAAREITASRERLEDMLSTQIRSFAYPGGGWNRALRDLVQSAGYTTGVTCRRGGNFVGQDRQALRRHIAEVGVRDLVRMIEGYYDFLGPINNWRERRRAAALVEV